ncbi:MAG: GNAT family N-acetyltransferase [Christensenella sp.]|nr:GNAT family N-acetyltransferase [Christensenella sp.]
MNWIYEPGRVYGVDETNTCLAEATYVFLDNRTVDINHTYVDPSLRGQGVAGEMMEAVAQQLRQDGLKAVASCSYANAWLMNHRDSYADVISDGLNR